MLLPIALFAYARPHHLAATLASLRACRGAGLAELTIFCDGSRGAVDAAAVAGARAIAHAADGFAAVRVVERECNLGLARSVSSGITGMLERHDRVVVVEDDLAFSPWFLEYMAAGLETYAGDPAVASVHGYVYPVDIALPETFFIPGADCWGWGTWRRAWAHWREDGAALRAELHERRLMRDFDLGGAAGYSRMLDDQIAGRNDSWAVRWHASTFLAGMHTLYPGRSLVANTGCDASGTHPVASQAFASQLSDRPIRVERAEVRPCPDALAAFARFHRRLHSPWQRVRRRLSRLAGGW